VVSSSTPQRAVAQEKTELGSITTTHRGGMPFSRSQWHARGARPYPDKFRYYDDLPALIREWIVPGHAPEAPLLSSDDKVITLGSCFARELRRYLNEGGFSAGNFWVPTGLNNTFAILDFVSWCVTGEQTGAGYRYDRDDEGDVREWTPDAERDEYLGQFESAGAFVFTLGLAEVWHDSETGQVFWRGVPKDVYDADRHAFRLTTVQENEENVLRIIELIRSVNPRAPIVLTLSPVPLMATFRDIPCLTADCVSKSVLRTALDLVIARKPENVYYWPSFEIVRWVGGHVPWRAYGADDHRARNVSRYLVSQIIDAFIESFYEPEAVATMRSRNPGSFEPAPTSLRFRASSAALGIRLGSRQRLKRVRRSTAKLLGRA
jgi:hypothetical protein